MAKIYLQLDYSKSEMYEYSKTEKEGYEAHTSKTGNVSYRKHYPKGVFGKLLNAGIRESNFGDNLNIVLKDGDDFVSLQFSMYDQKGNVENQYTESIIRHIGNLQKGESYRFFPYKITAESQKKEAEEKGEPKDRYYDLTGVSIKLADLETQTVTDKVEPNLVYSGDGDNVIPRVEWGINKAKKNVPNPVQLAEKNEFLLGKLMDAVEGPLAYEANASQEAPVAQNAKTSKKIPTVSPQEAFEPAEEDDNEDDDLPF